MHLDRLKSLALSLPRTAVVKQWGECLVFKVVDKMFFLVVLDGAMASAVIFKCTRRFVRRLLSFAQ